MKKKKQPELRYGMTEEELASLSEEQAKVLMAMWHPLPRAMFPEIIFEGFVICEKDNKPKFVKTKEVKTKDIVAFRPFIPLMVGPLPGKKRRKNPKLKNGILYL